MRDTAYVNPRGRMNAVPKVPPNRPPHENPPPHAGAHDAPARAVLHAPASTLGLTRQRAEPSRYVAPTTIVSPTTSSVPHQEYEPVTPTRPITDCETTAEMPYQLTGMTLDSPPSTRCALETLTAAVVCAAAALVISTSKAATAEIRVRALSGHRHPARGTLGTGPTARAFSTSLPATPSRMHLRPAPPRERQHPRTPRGGCPAGSRKSAATVHSHYPAFSISARAPSSSSR